MLPPAFGLAMGLSYAVGWLALGRVVTERTLLAVLFLAIAGTLAASVALVASTLMARRAWTARFAAATFCLTAGTVGLTALFMAIGAAWGSHPMGELPVHVVLLIVGYTGTATLYNFLALAGFLLLPLAVPAIVLFALLISRAPR